MNGTWKGQSIVALCAGIAAWAGSSSVANGQAPPPAQIRGAVINDANGNGVIEPGELGLAGWTVELVNAQQVIDVAVTDEQGRYEFLNQAPGAYVVRQVVEPGWRQTAPGFRTSIVPSPAVSGEWDYDDNDGDNAVGPANWPDVAPDAAGDFQSPVDISGATTDLSRVLTFHYPGGAPHELLNNGHNAEIEYEEDSGNHIAIGGEAFDLVQFHFHHDSEHAVNGQLQPMEMHLVHRHEEGGLAVVGVFIEEGQANEQLADFFTGLDEIEGLPAPDGVEFDHEIDLLDLLPDSTDGWFYNGSLTTPPATEGVNWFVFEEAIQASAEQIALFKEFLDSIELNPNNRPVEPLNGRRFNEIGFQINLEGDIDGLDFANTIPEPTTMGLLIAGAMGLFRPRRHSR